MNGKLLKNRNISTQSTLSLFGSICITLGPLQGLCSFIDHETDGVDAIQGLPIAIKRLIDDVSFGGNLKKTKTCQALLFESRDIQTSTTDFLKQDSQVMLM